jgi:hypothetical protein
VNDGRRRLRHNVSPPTRGVPRSRAGMKQRIRHPSARQTRAPSEGGSLALAP